MGRLISVVLILVSCSGKIDSSKLVDRYKQVVVSDKFLIITTEKQWFNSNLFLLNMGNYSKIKSSFRRKGIC